MVYWHLIDNENDVSLLLLLSPLVLFISCLLLLLLLLFLVIFVIFVTAIIESH